MIEAAYAMAPPAADGAQQGGGMSFIFVMILIFFVFYFLLIRPQKKQVDERQKMLNNLQKGDEVITNGGLHGKITGLTDTVVTLEIANNTRVKVSRGYIAGLQKEMMKDTQSEKDKEKEKKT